MILLEFYRRILEDGSLKLKQRVFAELRDIRSLYKFTTASVLTVSKQLLAVMEEATAKMSAYMIRPPYTQLVYVYKVQGYFELHCIHTHSDMSNINAGLPLFFFSGCCRCFEATNRLCCIMCHHIRWTHQHVITLYSEYYVVTFKQFNVFWK
jgi:hypothetical protein